MRSQGCFLENSAAESMISADRKQARADKFSGNRSTLSKEIKKSEARNQPNILPIRSRAPGSLLETKGYKIHMRHTFNFFYFVFFYSHI